MQKRSRKHHYLPRHYLHGFTDNSGGFFVYDKKSGKIFYISPDAAFFENDLNTVTIPGGDPSDSLEDLYTSIENQTWGSFDRIRASTVAGPIDIQDKLELFLFLSILHWRLPSNAAFAEKLSQDFFRPNTELGFLKLESRTDAPVPQDIVDAIRRSEVWLKASRLAVPFAPFYSASWFADVATWRFLYPADDKSWFLVGDNPIVTRGLDDHDPVNCLKDFIFPVSGRILLVSRGDRLAKVLPDDFVFHFGTAIIERASRFVACHNKEFLEALVSHHQLHVRSDKADCIIPELFERLAPSDGA